MLAVVGIAAAVLVSGCGGGGGRTTTQTSVGQPVVGASYTFRAPSRWTTTVTARAATARADETTLVSVTVLPLVKRYRLELFPKVVRELDRVAASLAARLKGKVTARRTIRVGGRQVRQYDIAHAGLIDRLTFVLRGKTEYLLTCRWRKPDGEPAGCGQLLRTFRLR